MGPYLIRIAIAENHTLFRNLLIECINAFPKCEIVADAENGKKLIDNIDRLEQKPDICILDISMPEMNGYDTLAALKKMYPDMKFLVLTMFEKAYCILRMIKTGANGYLLKSCTLNEIKEAITTIHNSGYYYSAQASEEIFAVVKNYQLPKLTDKELQFISLCCSNITYVNMGRIMCISARTVEDYQKTVCKKLNLHTRKEIALFAVSTGLISMNLY